MLKTSYRLNRLYKKVPSKYHKIIDEINNYIISEQDDFISEQDDFISELDDFISEQDDFILKLTSEHKNIVEEFTKSADDLSDEFSETLQTLSDELNTVHKYHPITKLPSVSSLYEIYEENIEDKAKCHVFTFEINNLHITNEVIGEELTDNALVIVANYLDDMFRRLLSKKSNFIIYHVGRMFIVIVRNCTLDKAIRLFNKISAKYKYYNLRKILKKLNITEKINFNVGFCSNNTNFEFLTIKDIVYCSKHASVKAKKLRQENHHQHIFEICDKKEKYFKQKNIYANLHDCIENNFEGFSIVYQPQVSLKNKSVYGLEALLRWKYNGIDFSPFDFIPIAEKSEAINKLGEWVIKEVCKQIQVWKSNEEFNSLKVSINISAKQLMTTKLDKTIKHIAWDYGVDSVDLGLEITESIPLNEKSKKMINKISKRFSEIAVDDYGTGCASLEHLSDVNYKIIKVDRKFVQDIEKGNAKHLSILKSIFQFAKDKDVGAKIIVEGVEKDTSEGKAGSNEKVFELLNNKKCIVQGYYFSEPLDPINAILWANNFSKNINQYTKRFPCLAVS